MFSQAYVILFTGGCLPQCMLGYTPPEQTPRSRPPGADPLEQTPPWSRHPPSRHPREQTSPQEQTPPEQTPWSRHPPGADTPQADTPQEQTPPWEQDPPIEHTGRYGQCAGGTHPTGIQSCFKEFFSTTKISPQKTRLAFTFRFVTVQKNTQKCQSS